MKTAGSILTLVWGLLGVALGVLILILFRNGLPIGDDAGLLSGAAGAPDSIGSVFTRIIDTIALIGLIISGAMAALGYFMLRADTVVLGILTLVLSGAIMFIGGWVPAIGGFLGGALYLVGLFWDEHQHR